LKHKKVFEGGKPLKIRYTLTYGVWQKPMRFGCHYSANPCESSTGETWGSAFGYEAMGWLYVNDAAKTTLLIDRAIRTKTRTYISAATFTC